MLVTWMMCKCYVWPIVLGSPVGACGRCGVRPEKMAGVEDTKEAYVATFEAHLGKMKPMEPR